LIKKHLIYILTLGLLLTSCGGGGGGGSEPSAPAPQNITVSLTSSADSAEVNSSITLTWSSTLATSCSASGAWSGSKGTTGSESITIGVGGSNTFSLSCSATGANSGSASTTVNGLRYFDGKVFDGYIRGAEVFVDTNDNLILDANEASVTTDNQGSFNNLLFGNGTLVARGGIDLDTGAELSDLTLVHKLEGYEASKLASPFTTLIAYMSDASNINAALGIDASINLLTTDPIPNLGEGIYDQMYEKGNQLTVLSYTLQNQATADSSQLYFEAIADQLEESYAANQTAVDIEDPTFISNVIDKAETASANTLTPEVKANLNTVLATTIPLLKVYADSNTTASVQRFAFSTLQNDVQDSAVIGSSSSAKINQYENNVFGYVATDQGIDEGTINPINNNAPTISLSATFSAAENQTAIGSISASDADGDSLTYSISGSEINLSSSGVLTFATAPDYETKTSYTATVTVSDGTDSVTQAITVTITDIDETESNEAPTLSINSNYSVNEDVNGICQGGPAIGDGNCPVFNILASDPEGEDLFYTISGPDAAAFQVSSAGAVNTTFGPNYEVPIDENNDGDYQITITVSDGNLSVSQAITITVTNINEAPFISDYCFDSDVLAGCDDIYVDENQTSALQINALDPENQTISYSFYNDSGNDDNSYFNISSSGAVTFKTTPDYETKNSYALYFALTDSDGLSAGSYQYNIRLNNLNDNTPVISSSATFSAAENQTAIGSISASDADGDSLTYSISGSEINISSSGVLTFATAPDYETKNSYTATVTVSDGTNAVTQDITINITDVDEAPTITSSSTFTIAENQTSVGSVTATDPENQSLTYAIYSLPAPLAGEQYSGGSINSSTGAITLNGTGFNYEERTSITAQVEVSDGTNAVTQDITINITDVNEAAPNAAPTISSSANFSAAENQTAIGSVTATDADGDSLTYSISGSEINISSSGVLTFVSAPDYESKNTYTATVTVSDGTASTTQDITVNVTDVNENVAPTISSSANFSAAENQTAIGSISASDANGDSLTYSISGSEINISSSGVLTFVSAPDYESKNTYTATVTVSDGAASTTQDITVLITDIGGIYENGIAGAISTSWNKGVDFDKSGGNTFARVPEITDRYTIFSKSHSNRISTFQPWGASITFKPGSNNTNQRLIQISAEDFTNLGAGRQAQVKDQGYLSIEGGVIKLRYRFYSAPVGDNSNVVEFTSSSFLTAGNWYSLYIYFNGDNDQGGFNRFAFKIYLVSLIDGTIEDLSTYGTWVETMSINTGFYNSWNWEDYEIGTENFDGTIAAFSATTYTSIVEPNNDEIRTMALDPIKWLNDYKVGLTYRTVFNPGGSPEQSEAGVFSLNSDEESYATQVFLMGDGGTDTSSTIYNQVHTGGSANLSLINSPSIVNISIE